MAENKHLAELVAACRWIGARGWSPATGGNMSQRRDAHSCFITASWLDKGYLSHDDFITVDIHIRRDAARALVSRGNRFVCFSLSAFSRGLLRAPHPFD